MNSYARQMKTSEALKIDLESGYQKYGREAVLKMLKEAVIHIGSNSKRNPFNSLDEVEKWAIECPKMAGFYLQAYKREVLPYVNGQ